MLVGKCRESQREFYTGGFQSVGESPQGEGRPCTSEWPIRRIGFCFPTALSQVKKVWEKKLQSTARENVL